MTSGRERRFVSDSLQFTGVDLGDRENSTSRRHGYYDTDDDVDNSVSSGDGSPVQDPSQMAIRDGEDALVEKAMQRIQRARLKGKTDVKLNKDELAALERRKKRMQEEAERKKHGSGSGSDRKKRKDQRIAVPLSHLEPISRKKKSKHPPKQDPVPRQASAADLAESHERQGYPPVGFFPPPSGARSRPRSGTALSHRPPSRNHDERGSSPFSYEYVQRPSSSHRHVSDTTGQPRSARGYPAEEGWYLEPSPASSSASLGGRTTMDPFQYQTSGPRVQYPHGTAAAQRRYVSGPSKIAYSQHMWPMAAAPAAPGSRLASRRASPDDDGTSEDYGQTSDEGSASDDRGNGAQIREPARGRAGGIIVEVSPEREPEPVKKKSSHSPVKRKPVQGGRRKKK